MGLDLTIREQQNFSSDEQGRTVWQTVELGNLRNCHNILDEFSNRLEFGFENCATHSFDEGTFFAILDKLKKDLVGHKNGTYKCMRWACDNETDEEYQTRCEKYNKTQVANLEYEIGKLEKFIQENNLQRQEPTEEDEEYGTFENYGRTFEVHAWF